MAAHSTLSPEYLAETNDPGLDQRVSIAFIVIDTFFLLLFYVSRYFNPKAIGIPMLVCNTLCFFFCMGSAVAGICESCPPRLCDTNMKLQLLVWAAPLHHTGSRPEETLAAIGFC